MEYGAIVKDNGILRTIKGQYKNKTQFIEVLRDNDFKVNATKVKEISIFNRVLVLIDYVDSKEEAEIIWQYIKSENDTLEIIFDRYNKKYFNF